MSGGLISGGLGMLSSNISNMGANAGASAFASSGKASLMNNVQDAVNQADQMKDIQEGLSDKLQGDQIEMKAHNEMNQAVTQNI
jgi:hypothetical protein